MTRDEIMALSDEELRGSVALAKGWSIAPSAPRGQILGSKSPMKGLVEIPSYTTDISAVWELVEEAHLYEIRKRLKGGVMCRLFPDAHYYIGCEGPTVYIAICRAYLVWKHVA